jgi:hypothetical protein
MQIDVLRDRVRYLRWRWVTNAPDSVAYVLRPDQLDEHCSAAVQALRLHGFATFQGIPKKDLFRELRADAIKIRDYVWDSTSRTPISNALDRKVDRGGLGTLESKEFLQILTPRTFDADSIYIRYALQPQFIAIANAYLGLRAKLRAVHLWLTYPTEGEPASTQLWHRDADDFVNLKIFTYLTDVDIEDGPFAYIPGTQRLGYRRICPVTSGVGRTTDQEMGRVAAGSEWRICLGRAGTVVFADTSGYHKGVKPIRNHRLMLMVHYASRASVSELKMNQPYPAWLSDRQRRVLP